MNLLTFASGIALCYLLASIAIALSYHPTLPTRFPLKQVYLFFSVSALSLHGALLYQTILPINGIDLGFYNALSMVTWIGALISGVIALNKPINSLLIVTYPLAGIALAMQIMLHKSRLVGDSTSLGLQVHIILSTTAYSVLMLATLQSIVLYLQEYMLRKKRLANVLALFPAVQPMERLLVQLILVGFFLLSLSIASGIMFLYDIFGQHLVHKTVLSISAWLIYSVLLWGIWKNGWRSTTITKWALGGGIFLALGYFGSKLVLELILKRA